MILKKNMAKILRVVIKNIRKYYTITKRKIENLQIGTRVQDSLGRKHNDQY